MSTPSTPAKLVLIASSQPALAGYVREIMKDIYTFEYLQVESLESFIENPPQIQAPILAVVDGTLGTQVCSEWIQTVKMNYKSPLVVIHDSSVTLDFAILKKNGADRIVHRSFDQEFVIDLILEIVSLDWDKDIPLVALNPIATEELHPEMEINFDVYIHLPGNHKTVLLRRKGAQIEEKTLKKFEQGQQHFYFKKTETKQFLEYARTSLTMKESSRNVAQTERLIKSKKVIFEIMSEFFNGQTGDFGAGRAILERCKKIIGEYELLKTYSPKDAHDYLVFLTNNARTLYHDAINVATFAALIGHMLEMPIEKIESLALAGLLHNIGLSAVPSYKPGMDISSLSQEEMVQYKRYPEISVNMVKSKKVPLDQFVSDAILEHQENANGSGFPRGIDASQFSELGKILRLAYDIQEKTSLVNGAAKIQGKEIIAQLREQTINGTSFHDISMLSKLYKCIPKAAA